MRVIFIYVSYKHGFGQNIDYDTREPSQNYYAKRFEEEGYSLLLDKMVDAGVVDQALCIIESQSSPGYFKCHNNINGYVIPSIEDLSYFLKPGDVIWVRGGWRHWHDTLVEIQKSYKHWMLVYAANTGREKWLFWDVIFDDIGGVEYVDDHNRLHLDFRKPMNEDIFKYEDIDFTQDNGYDFMIGASRIHDKKGQWKVIDALVELKRKGVKPKCTMPGPMARGVETNRILTKINGYGLNVMVPGNLAREDLAKIMNHTRYIIHMGSGQGDRGVMEAMACGCNPLIGSPRHHAKWLTNAPFVRLMSSNPTQLVRQLDLEFYLPYEYSRKEISYYWRKNAGIKERCIPDMERLFSFFRKYPDREDDLIKREWR